MPGASYRRRLRGTFDAEFWRFWRGSVIDAFASPVQRAQGTPGLRDACIVGPAFQRPFLSDFWAKTSSFVYERLVRWLHRRGGQRATRWVRWTAEQFHGMGLYRLRGTVRYPAQAASVRSSLSRVRENRTHGLKGVC